MIRHHQEAVSAEQTDVTIYTENRTRSVFIRDLPYFCTSTDLKELFEDHLGNCVEESIVCFNRHGQSLHYGYVMFYDEADAQRSVDIMNGIRHDGRDLRVQVFTKEAPAENSKEGKIYVSFIAQSELVPRVSESTMRAAFELTFPGHFIDHISIRSHKPSDQGLASGFGFVSFENEAINRQVVQMIRQRVINDVKYDCNFSRKHQQLILQQQQQMGMMGGGSYENMSYGSQNSNGYNNNNNGYYQQQSGRGFPPRDNGYDSRRFNQQYPCSEPVPPRSHYGQGGRGPVPTPAYVSEEVYDPLNSGRSMRSAARDIMRTDDYQHDDYSRFPQQQQPTRQAAPPVHQYGQVGGGYSLHQHQQAPPLYQQQPQGYGIVPPPPHQYASPPQYQFPSPPMQYQFPSPPQYPSPPLALQMPYGPMSPPLVHAQISPHMLAVSPSPQTMYLPFGGSSPFFFERSPAQPTVTAQRPQYLSTMNYLQQAPQLHQPIRNRPSWQYFQELSMSQQQQAPQVTPPQNYRQMPNAIPNTYQQQGGGSNLNINTGGGYRGNQTNAGLSNNYQPQQQQQAPSVRPVGVPSMNQQPQNQPRPLFLANDETDVLQQLRPRALSGDTAFSGSHRSVYSADLHS